jgi:hypothetical protein
MNARNLALGASALAIAFSLGVQARANDSSAELAQGGLVLKKHDGIAMKSEDLYISPDAVRVKYEFLNTTARDEKIIVAFPMPDITTEGVDDNIAIPDIQQPENFLDFKTAVEGLPVAAHVEQRVFKNGVEYTALLRKLGIPLMPLLQETDQKLDALSAANKQALIKVGLVSDDEYDDGHGMQHHLGAAWTLKTTYWWEQIFPAGKILHVQHDYKPSVGGTAGTFLEMDDARANEEYKPYAAKYCIDDGLLAAVKKEKAAVGPEHQAYYEQRIDYILKTGANWKEPIGDFRLVMDKGAATNLLSVCQTGVKKIGPTQFEVHRTNYAPDRDLHMLILVRVPAEGIQ